MTPERTSLIFPALCSPYCWTRQAWEPLSKFVLGYQIVRNYCLRVPDPLKLFLFKSILEKVMTNRTIFLTTALPYANGNFHFGHIMEYIQADIWVRHQRMCGSTVHFVGADDAHGAPIMISAQKKASRPRNMSPKSLPAAPSTLTDSLSASTTGIPPTVKRIPSSRRTSTSA